MIEYQKAKTLSLSAEHGKVSTRLQKAVDLFGKEIVKLDNTIEKCEDRMRTIQVLLNEKSFVSSMIDEIGESNAKE